ncbi:MAG: nicotinate (nicotinamide) nucleotide adenylyltransferase [Planctomycetes bacterium]|nr:nicotinate (nicotinamide) nucleotide adenylyltransferase [Planctomycetota bacterium]
MNTVVFGGSFDPLHCGHLAVADAVQSKFSVDEFLWTPSWHAVHKPDVQPAAAEFRVRCIESVLVGRSANESVCRLEVAAQRGCYSVDTLEELRSRNPQRKLHFLIGGDSLSHLNTWHDLPRLFTCCTFLLVPRPHWGAAQLQTYRQQLSPELSELFSAQFIDMPVVDICSSSIRQQLLAGNSVTGLPESVQRLIAEYKVYSAV